MPNFTICHTRCGFDLILSREITETFARSVASTYYAIALFLVYTLLYRY